MFIFISTSTFVHVSSFGIKILLKFDLLFYVWTSHFYIKISIRGGGCSMLTEAGLEARDQINASAFIA